ncbi:MAG: nucleotide exchange factor GrpE [Syntrophorhabdaceae bacterium]|nr:nucleotide exchange factor GrpE [Syntrophorhabdaceae bacterium]
MEHHNEKKDEKESPSKEEATPHEDQKKRKKKDEIIEELQKTIQEKEETIKGLQEKILYLQADFENFKKLKNREKEETLRFGNEVLIKNLLPVVDNLERAIDHSSKTSDFKSIYDGVKIVLNEFLKVLEKAGVERIEAVGKKFDPNLHEAFLQEENNDMEPGTILSEFQRGYILNGRLLRPSMVTISKKSEQDS